MPKRTDLHSILIIGSGPIVIGQACEFDYSGAQACKALREEGYKVILVNSNPATIMTDPEMADRTYIEPITPECVAKIIEKERPDALLPTLGGQTALNTAMRLAKAGTLEKYGVELIGASVEVINRAEERELFKATMEQAGMECLKGIPVHTVDDAVKAAAELGYPVIVRPSFTLGGTGGGTAYDEAGLRKIAKRGLEASLSTEVLIEESVLGWKEYELELMRDRNDNVVIICAIENVDPMGIHTGDSLTVAPTQTLTDREYQKMRDWGIRVMRAIGVETGGSNVQFCIHPGTGRMAIIEMNPRVSRSSALASKATGFPIAKIAAKLAVGYTLDELPNDITRETPASFEPTLDYTVVKIPRFAFEKFPGADPSLGVSMKSVGEVMAIGSNFREALQKAFRGLEMGVNGLDLRGERFVSPTDLETQVKHAGPKRFFALKVALKHGWSVEQLAEATRIDPWFLDQVAQIVETEAALLAAPPDQDLPEKLLRRAKRDGFSDRQILEIRGGEETELVFRKKRQALGIAPVYRLVDTCAGEFEAYTPYYYSSYMQHDSFRPSDKPKMMVLGSGPNRIGQGIEFDYCCVHTVKAAQELGYEAIMVNSNPETVSTDYDTSDKLYFEPLTFEDVMAIYEREQPEGVIVQMGGQTPLNLAVPLHRAGVRILGTDPDSIDRAEDRKRTRELLESLGLQQPESATVSSAAEALETARRIGLPVMIRPSYVLGGRAMIVAYREEDVLPFVEAAFEASPDFPVLIDRFLENAVEVDVDVVADGEGCFIGGVMQHIEAAGIHSGDSACSTPPYSLDEAMVARIEDAARRIALELQVKGIMNLQCAVKDGELYVIEINPRASRTVPYVAKATGIPLARIAAKVAMGAKLKDLGLPGSRVVPPWFAVKEAVFPFNRFQGVDPVLGPEMKSTGEVMGIDPVFEAAYWKSQIAANQNLPREGNVFLSLADRDKTWAVEAARRIIGLGFNLFSTKGTAGVLREAGIEVTPLHKLADGEEPTVLTLMQDDRMHLVINTPSGRSPMGEDEIRIRSECILRGIPIITTWSGADVSLRAIEHMAAHDYDVCPLQDFYPRMG